jgi:uncharacterized membrane-anchored protein
VPTIHFSADIEKRGQNARTQKQGTFMRWALALLAGLGIFVAAGDTASTQTRTIDQIEALNWQRASGSGQIGEVASIQIDGNLQFLDATGTRRFLELNGNPPRDGQYTLARRDYRWFAVFSFDASGYVKDDEAIDPDELLRVLQKTNRSSIEERKRLNLPVLILEGWSVSPHYDVKTRRLEWGTRLRGEDDSLTVNYSIRLLGRTGVMSAVLVSDPEELQNDLKEFRAALNGFDFNTGYRYAEFRSGDRIAEYGLGALIVGGAAAAAAKSGGFLKVLVIGAFGLVAAFFAFVRRLFGRT